MRRLYFAGAVIAVACTNLAACNNSDNGSPAATSPSTQPTTIAENIGQHVGAAIDRGIDRAGPELHNAEQDAKNLAHKTASELNSALNNTTNPASTQPVDNGHALIDKCNLDLARGDLTAAQIDLQQLQTLRPRLSPDLQAKVDDLQTQLNAKQNGAATR